MYKNIFCITLLFLVTDALASMENSYTVVRWDALRANTTGPRETSRINKGCPEHERYEMRQLKNKEGDSYFYYPEDMIEKADDTDQIPLTLGIFRKLEDEALNEQKRRTLKISEVADYPTYEIKPSGKVTSPLKEIMIWLRFICKEKTTRQLPREITKTIATLADNLPIMVTEYEIVRLLPFLAFQRTTEPQQAIIKINDTFEKFGSPIKEIIYDYEHHKGLLEDGWSSCREIRNNVNSFQKPILWYRPCYFNEECYKTQYGPRFRNTIFGDETDPFYDMAEYYNFSEDPTFVQNLNFLKKAKHD